jgi:hypothetical protein
VVTVASEPAFLADFLPVIRRNLMRSGCVIDHGQYYTTRYCADRPP